MLCNSRSGGFLNCESVVCGKRAVQCELLEDISDMYSPMLCKDYVVEKYFVVSIPHHSMIQSQLQTYKQLANDDGFWLFLANRRRKALLPLHLKIEEFVKNGIPPPHRAKMWIAMSGIQTKPTQYTSYLYLFFIILKKLNKRIYSDLLEQKQEDIYASQIKLDVPRSFPAIQDPEYFTKLTRLLTAYSCRNSKLGYLLSSSPLQQTLMKNRYCQSMNMLAGTLLIFMEEEQAFWMFVHLVEDLLPNYHSLTMSGFLADAQLFEWLVANNLPELYKHFRRLQIDLIALTAPWFLCLFIHELPPETSFLVWDNIMMEGISVLFEVGLAVLRLYQTELLQYNCEGELMLQIRKRTQELYDVDKLHSNWHKLDKNQIKSAKRNIKQRVEEEESRVALITVQLSEIAPNTHYDEKELANLWRQHTVIFPFLCRGNVADATKSPDSVQSPGINFKQFSMFVGGTFSEWWVDSEVVEQLFKLTDANNDGVVEFTELVSLLSVMCRGSFTDVVEFNFQLFDVKTKGGIDKYGLARMLQSIYGVFRSDKAFFKLIRNFVNDIFDFPGVSGSDSITLEQFDNVVLVQAQILQRFLVRNPNLKFNPKNTYFFWVLDFERQNRYTDIIHIALDRNAPHEQPNVPKPSMFQSSFNFSVY